MGIATLIAAGLTHGTVSAARDALAGQGLVVGEASYIDPERACDLVFDGPIEDARAALRLVEAEADVVVQPREGRRKRLLVADMDSTMITVECIDELADYAGLKTQVAAITERAMQGELDFAEALRARVALLEGMPVVTLGECYRERVRLMPGARTLVATMRAHGAWTLLVSGGFTAFADPVAAELGFDSAIANVLEVAAGALTGEVAVPIVDGARKASALAEAAAARGLAPAETLGVGDGANDLAMIRAAGLGVAFHAKPLLANAADARIARGDLTALLYAQRYPRSEWL